MAQSALIDATLSMLKQTFGNERSGHDYWHMYRVWQLAKHIAHKESGADMHIVELGALLHDIADHKFHDGDLEAGPRAARAWLAKHNVEERVIAQVEDIVRNISFKGAKVPSSMATIEGKIVHDADKLDALGAIGIARCFAYGGATGQPMHEPDLPVVLHNTFQDYRTAKTSSINHFHEKLLLLKDRMYTDTGKALAQQRHDTMVRFLADFMDEWEGKR